MRVGVEFLRILQFMHFVSLEFRDFADFEILRISSFVEFEIPCRSRTLLDIECSLGLMTAKTFLGLMNHASMVS